MNEQLMKGLLKMVKTMISPDQMKSAVSSLVQMGIDYKNAIPLNPEAGECQAAAMIYEIEGVAMVCIAILNSDDKIVRTEAVKTLDEIADTIIKKL
jgi:hypothetical protein